MNPGFKKGHIPHNKLERKIRYCVCGCKNTFECTINSKKRFIKGHQFIKENNGMYGKKQSQKYKNINSEIKKGKKLSEEHKEKIRNNVPRLWNSPHWRGGKSFEIHSIIWDKSLKNRIRKRDNYICQNCNITKEENIMINRYKLSIHHIDYNKQNSEESNLITSYFQCHSRTNFNRDYWKKYYIKKVMSYV